MDKTGHTMEEYIGKICPYCKTTFAEGDEIVQCSACEMPHHKDCWIENQGCTTFGCQGTIRGLDGQVYGGAAQGVGKVCPNCGAQNIGDSIFCARCGARMAQANAPAGQAASGQSPAGTAFDAQASAQGAAAQNQVAGQAGKTPAQTCASPARNRLLPHQAPVLPPRRPARQSSSARPAARAIPQDRPSAMPAAGSLQGRRPRLRPARPSAKTAAPKTQPKRCSAMDAAQGYTARGSRASPGRMPRIPTMPSESKASLGQMPRTPTTPFAGRGAAQAPRQAAGKRLRRIPAVLSAQNAARKMPPRRCSARNAAPGLAAR